MIMFCVYLLCALPVVGLSWELYRYIRDVISSVTQPKLASPVQLAHDSIPEVKRQVQEDDWQRTVGLVVDYQERLNQLEVKEVSFETTEAGLEIAKYTWRRKNAF